jgi:hypothetical protein
MQNGYYLIKGINHGKGAKKGSGITAVKGVGLATSRFSPKRILKETFPADEEERGEEDFTVSASEDMPDDPRLWRDAKRSFAACCGKNK